MKQRNYILGKLIFLCAFLSAQIFSYAQDPHFSQFYANPVYFNPAFAGAAECPRINLAYRNQWPNIPGAFSTISATYDQHINALAGGIGAVVVNDRQGGGSYNNISVGLSYSYKVNFRDKFFMRAGVQAAFVNRYINWNDLRFPDQYDPLLGYVRPQSKEDILSTPTSKSYADFSVGLLGYNEYFYVGVAVNHLSRPDEGFMGIQRLPMKIVAQAGGQIYFKRIYNQKRNPDDYSISPNIIYMNQGKFNELSYGLYANIKPVIFGMWYRQSFVNADALVFLAGVQIRGIRVGYSYDLTLSRLNKGGGAHEITFGVQFNCPQRDKQKRIQAIPCPAF